MQYFRQMDDLTLLKRLDATVARFMKRFRMTGMFRPKSFMRTFWQLRHPAGRPARYIPDFDTYSLHEMRGYLDGVAQVPGVAGMSAADVEARFNLLIEREVSRLEVDVGTTS